MISQALNRKDIKTINNIISALFLTVICLFFNENTVNAAQLRTFHVQGKFINSGYESLEETVFLKKLLSGSIEGYYILDTENPIVEYNKGYTVIDWDLKLRDTSNKIVKRLSSKNISTSILSIADLSMFYIPNPSVRMPVIQFTEANINTNFFSMLKITFPHQLNWNIQRVYDGEQPLIIGFLESNGTKQFYIDTKFSKVDIVNNTQVNEPKSFVFGLLALPLLKRFILKKESTNQA